jgi:hypothetical protein
MRANMAVQPHNEALDVLECEQSTFATMGQPGGVIPPSRSCQTWN